MSTRPTLETENPGNRPSALKCVIVILHYQKRCRRIAQGSPKSSQERPQCSLSFELYDKMLCLGEWKRLRATIGGTPETRSLSRRIRVFTWTTNKQTKAIESYTSNSTNKNKTKKLWNHIPVTRQQTNKSYPVIYK